MHDLVRDLARQIGRQELPLRLCCSNDKMIPTRYNVFTQQYGVRGIRGDEDHELPVFLQNQEINGLKILAVQNSSILQQFNSVSGDLIWLRSSGSKDTSNHSALSWSCLRNIPSTLLLRSLRVLELHGVSPHDFCNLFDDREPPSQLRAFEVAFNRDFGSASTGTAGPSTAVFKKHGSTSESLQPPIAIGQTFQSWLGKLNFRNLGKIVLQNIPGLKTLPIKFEEVRNLRHVDLSGCGDLEVLPESFTEELLQLQYLALRDCRNLVLQDLGKISTLEYLDFQGCSMLKEMPKGTEVQKSLKHLNVVHTDLRKLPDNLEELEELEELHIGSSGLTEMPSSLYNLSRLTDLTLIGCTNLLLIGNSIEKLVHLESFRIYKCGVRTLPVTIARVNMKILDVQDCPLDMEQLLTGVDPGNMPLDSSQVQGSIGQSARPNRPGCLTDLIIRHSRILEIDIPQAESLFPNLEILDLSDNRLLTEIGRLPANLTSLKLTNCSQLTRLACLSNLARLRVLDISGCGELETLNVEGLKSIQVIKANRCRQLQSFEGLDLLEQLSCFQISVGPSWMPLPVLRRHLFEEIEKAGGRVLKVLENRTEASVLIEDAKPSSAIWLFLVTEGNCEIEVSFLGHTYTTHSSTVDTDIHMLMWRKDSEVFNDFKFSNDDAIHFNINVRKTFQHLDKPPLRWGWMVEAVNGQVSKGLFNLFGLFKLFGLPTY